MTAERWATDNTMTMLFDGYTRTGAGARISYRHANGINLLFWDGHAARYGQADSIFLTYKPNWGL